MQRILVVDDEAPLRRALETNLRARGYDVDLAGTGEQALDLAAPRHPHMVVLDLGLPETRSVYGTSRLSDISRTQNDGGLNRQGGGVAAGRRGADDGGVTNPHTAVVVAMDGLQLLDLAGPVEVLRIANRLGGEPAYRSLVATPGGADVRSDSGVRVGADVSLGELARSRRRIDTLTVVGGPGTYAAIADEGFLADVTRLSQRAGRTTSVCSGSLVLAAAGLLDGYAATTHWALSDELAAYDAVDARTDQIFVHDRDRWTSAGITAGIDLFLALVEEDHGPKLAHRAARWLVVFVRRPGGQSQFSTQLRARPASTPSIAELQRWLSDHLDADLCVDALAARAGMSKRNFTRAFRRETGSSPAAYVEQLRVETACRLLETTDLTVGAVARRVGIRHAETLHRTFRRRVGTTPDLYRQHFGQPPR